jgi:hypothetical protein
MGSVEGKESGLDHYKQPVCPYLGAGIILISAKLLCSKVCRVAHILPPEDARPEELVDAAVLQPAGIHADL